MSPTSRTPNGTSGEGTPNGTPSAHATRDGAPKRTPMRAPTPRANDDFLARQQRRERMKTIWKAISFVVFLGLAGWRLVVWVRDFGEAPASTRRR